ncbi:MAG TPA: hypothetical protein VM553_11915 [Dongiaceae bacterium]|nr:hypothetical protein [Dongiaceae bacterium]
MAKKQHVSVRLTESDHRKMKEIARRLGVKESDLFRFIVKNSLSKLLPFQDGAIRGADLVPALLDCGQELARYFDLDSDQLDQIVNGGLEETHKKIDKEDLDILVMSGASDHYAMVKLAALTHQPIEKENLFVVLKNYFLGKYPRALNLLEGLNQEPAALSGNPLKHHSLKENQYA